MGEKNFGNNIRKWCCFTVSLNSKGIESFTNILLLWILLILSGHAGCFTYGNCVTVLKSEHITEQHNKNMPLKWAHSCVPASRSTITNLSFSTSAKPHPALCFWSTVIVDHSVTLLGMCPFISSFFFLRKWGSYGYSVCQCLLIPVGSLHQFQPSLIEG